MGKRAKTSGAIAELRVATDLLARGYHIFRSVSPASPCDLIALKDGLCITIEVRTIKVTTISKATCHEHEPGSIDLFAFLKANKIIYYNPRTQLMVKELNYANYRK